MIHHHDEFDPQPGDDLSLSTGPLKLSPGQLDNLLEYARSKKQLSADQVRDLVPVPEEVEGEPPYLYRVRLLVERVCNSKYDEAAKCKCGHPYYRHFDGYDDDAPVGCKYCMCYTFVPK